MRLTEKQIIKVLCEIAIHVGLCDSEPTVDNVIKGLHKANCKKCDELASELLALQGEPTKDIPLDMIENWADYEFGIFTEESDEDITKRGAVFGAKAMQSGEIARWAKENE